MDVLITGATGFVGLTVCEYLSQQNGVSPLALVRESSPVERLPDDVDTVQGDIVAPDGLAAVPSSVDAVVHLAAARGKPWQETQTINVDGSRAVAEFAEQADVQELIFTSTVRAHPETPGEPRNEYERTKVAAGKAIRTATDAVSPMFLYPTHVFGPKDYRLFQGNYLFRVASNAVLFPPLYTYKRFNVVHVEDVARNVSSVLTGDVEVDRQVVSGENVAEPALFSMIADELTDDARVIPVPYPLIQWLLAPVAGWLHRRGISPVSGERFTNRQRLGHQPEQFVNAGLVASTTARKTIRETTDWYEQVGLI